MKTPSRPKAKPRQNHGPTPRPTVVLPVDTSPPTPATSQWETWSARPSTGGPRRPSPPHRRNDALLGWGRQRQGSDHRPRQITALGRRRLLHYEVHCWTHGSIPDHAFAIDTPVKIPPPPATENLLRHLTRIHALTRGRHPFDTRDMGNSNSSISSLLTPYRSGSFQPQPALTGMRAGLGGIVAAGHLEGVKIGGDVETLGQPQELAVLMKSWVGSREGFVVHRQVNAMSQVCLQHLFLRGLASFSTKHGRWPCMLSGSSRRVRFRCR